MLCCKGLFFLRNFQKKRVKFLFEPHKTGELKVKSEKLWIFFLYINNVPQLFTFNF